MLGWDSITLVNHPNSFSDSTILPPMLANGTLNEFFLLIIPLLKGPLPNSLHNLSREWWTLNQFGKCKIDWMSSFNIWHIHNSLVFPVLHTKADDILTTFPPIQTATHNTIVHQYCLCLHTSFHLTMSAIVSHLQSCFQSWLILHHPFSLHKNQIQFSSLIMMPRLYSFIQFTCACRHSIGHPL